MKEINFISGANANPKCESERLKIDGRPWTSQAQKTVVVLYNKALAHALMKGTN